MKLKDIPEDVLNASTKFFDTLSETNIQPGGSCTFTCPICGATAIAKRSKLNGHLHASCTGCGMAVIE